MEVRALVLATILRVKDGHLIFPFCDICYCKVNVESGGREQRRFLCTKCNRSFAIPDLRHRYRLSVTISDGSAVCDASIFGKCLDVVFGTDAAHLNRLLHQYINPNYQTENARDDMLHHNMTDCIVGKQFYLGFKISPKNKTTTSSSSPYYNLKQVLSLLRPGDEMTVTTDGLVAYQILTPTLSVLKPSMFDLLKQAHQKDRHLSTDLVNDPHNKAPTTHEKCNRVTSAAGCDVNSSQSKARGSSADDSYCRNADEQNASTSNETSDSGSSSHFSLGMTLLELTCDTSGLSNRSCVLHNNEVINSSSLSSDAGPSMMSRCNLSQTKVLRVSNGDMSPKHTELLDTSHSSPSNRSYVFHKIERISSPSDAGTSVVSKCNSGPVEVPKVSSGEMSPKPTGQNLCNKSCSIVEKASLNKREDKSYLITSSEEKCNRQNSCNGNNQTENCQYKCTSVEATKIDNVREIYKCKSPRHSKSLMSHSLNLNASLTNKLRKRSKQLDVGMSPGRPELPSQINRLSSGDFAENRSHFWSSAPNRPELPSQIKRLSSGDFAKNRSHFSASAPDTCNDLLDNASLNLGDESFDFTNVCKSTDRSDNETSVRDHENCVDSNLSVKETTNDEKESNASFSGEDLPYSEDIELFLQNMEAQYANSNKVKTTIRKSNNKLGDSVLRIYSPIPEECTSGDQLVTSTVKARTFDNSNVTKISPHHKINQLKEKLKDHENTTESLQQEEEENDSSKNILENVQLQKTSKQNHDETTYFKPLETLQNHNGRTTCISHEDQDNDNDSSQNITEQLQSQNSCKDDHEDSIHESSYLSYTGSQDLFSQSYQEYQSAVNETFLKGHSTPFNEAGQGEHVMKSSHMSCNRHSVLMQSALGTPLLFSPDSFVQNSPFPKMSENKSLRHKSILSNMKLKSKPPRPIIAYRTPLNITTNRRRRNKSCTSTSRSQISNNPSAYKSCLRRSISTPSLFTQEESNEENEGESVNSYCQSYDGSLDLFSPCSQQNSYSYNEYNDLNKEDVDLRKRLF